MSWAELDVADVRLTPSPLESRRFGVSIARLTIGDRCDPAQVPGRVRCLLAERRDDVVIARWPTRLTSLGRLLSETSECFISADVLTYWSATAERLAGRGAKVDAGLEVSPGSLSPDDLALVTESVIRDSFLHYPNHYSANPIFDTGAVLDGYVEWALGAAARSPDDVILLWARGQAIGVATLEPASDGRDLEVALAGLTASGQGRGWYATLLRAVGRTALVRGIPRVVISTQVHNVGVQRAWARLGLLPFSTFSTGHLMRR